MTSFAHFMGDLYPGFIPALLPVFRETFDLSYFEAGVLGTIPTVMMLVQPVLGELGDRLSPKGAVALGVFLSAVFYSLIGLAGSFWMIAGTLVMAATGVTLFHPCAASLTGSREFRWMAVFTAGGSIGFGAGILIAGSLAQARGLDWLPFVGIPGILAAAYIGFFSGLSPGPAKKGGAGVGGLVRELRAAGRPFLGLWILAAARAFTCVSFTSYLAILVREREGGYFAGAVVVAVYAVAGAPASYLGGRLADRLGWKKVMVGSFFLGAGALYLALRTPGFWALLPITVGGAAMLSSAPLNIVLGQRLMPKSAGFSSSLMMGLAWGTGALLVPGVGRLADAFEAAGVATPTEAALTLVLVAPVAAGLGSLFLSVRRNAGQ